MAHTGLYSLSFVVLIAMATFLAMFTFESDLITGGYNITTSFSTEDDTATELIRDLNSTSSDIEGALTGEQGWLQTAYNIFFTLPNTVISSVSTLANSAGKMVSMTAGEEGHIPLPEWVLPVAYAAIALVIVFGLIYLALGRRSV